jgi:hypothetical protein
MAVMATSVKAREPQRRRGILVIVLISPGTARKCRSAVTVIGMTLLTLLLVSLFLLYAGARYELQRRELRRGRTHTSVAGVLGAITTDPQTPKWVELLLREVSVGTAASRTGVLSDFDIRVLSSATVYVPVVSDMITYCHNWLESGESVRLEFVREGDELIHFSITDELGLGISHGRAEFLLLGERPVE